MLPPTSPPLGVFGPGSFSEALSSDVVTSATVGWSVGGAAFGIIICCCCCFAVAGGRVSLRRKATQALQELEPVRILISTQDGEIPMTV